MSASLSLLFLGATTTISLVAAIGAQGTFVLRQGILGRHITSIIIFLHSVGCSDDWLGRCGSGRSIGCGAVVY